jgi:general stress protein 26
VFNPKEYSKPEIEQFLGVAHEAIRDLRHCWLATRSEDGGANARLIDVRHPTAPGDDRWTRRALVRRGSRKVREIAAHPRVTLAFQHPSGDRYVALGGIATLSDDSAEIQALWSGEIDAELPPGWALANLIVLRVDVDRVELHARGITPGPWGTGRTLLQRIGPDWRYVPY